MIWLHCTGLWAITKSIKVHTKDIINYIDKIQLERGIISVSWDSEIPRRYKNIWEIDEILNNLEDGDQVIVTTDKTNSFRSVSINQIFDYGE